MRPRISVTTALVALALAGCGGDDETTTTSGTATTTTSTTTGASGATGATGSEGEAPTETEGAPIEEVVATAAGVEPDEVDCGEEELEAALGGGGTCEAGGDEYVVAGFGEKLELDTLTARLTDLETTRTARGDYRRPQRSKRGTFVIGKLAVTNTAKRDSQLFDDFGEQVRLDVGEMSYAEPFPILNGVLTDSFLWKGNKIRAGDTQVGRVVFDVPTSAAKELEIDGSLVVLNFPDQGNFRRAEQIGVIRAG